MTTGATCSEGLKHAVCWQLCARWEVEMNDMGETTRETGQSCTLWEAEMDDMGATTQRNGREEWRGGPALQTHPGSASRG